MIVGALVVIVGVGLVRGRSMSDPVQVETLVDLERELESLRSRLRIPGMSAAIADGDRIVWARGFGQADVERGIDATSDTIYPIASLTKPYAATVMLQLVEEGRVDLDTPVALYGIDIERSGPVTIRHLLSHTAGEPPGAAYRYDGNAFGQMTGIIEAITGRPFARELSNRIIIPLGLTATAPYPGEPRGFRSLALSYQPDETDIERGKQIFGASGLDRAPIQAALAQGYARAWGRWIWPAGLAGPMRPMANGFTLSATNGLVASAPDVARFSMALADGRLLLRETVNHAWEPYVSAEGERLPYGLAWFVQDIGGQKVVWHYGQVFESSSLIVKVPERRLTFVILANSDGLSRSLGLGDDADVTVSPAARIFLKFSSSFGENS